MELNAFRIHSFARRPLILIDAIDSTITLFKMKIPLLFTNFNVVGHRPGNEAKRAARQDPPARLSILEKTRDMLPFKFKDRVGRRVTTEAFALQRSSATAGGNRAEGNAQTGISLARKLTDSRQNQAVLDAASAVIEGRMTEEEIQTTHGLSVAAEAMAAARSRQRLAALTEPVHISVVWAMYSETGRMVPSSEHPHGEDFVRTKVNQLDWLTKGLSNVTWNIIACDDGCPDQPSSADLMKSIVETEGYAGEGHRSVTVLKLADLIGGKTSINPAFDAMTSTSQSRKGGSILAGIDAALKTGPAHENSKARQVVCYTDADLSANLAQLGSLVAPVVAGNAAGALGQRYGIDGAVLIRPDGPIREPRSTGDKPDKLIVLFRHFVRATLIPSLSHVLDTQAGFKAFDATALGPAIKKMSSFNETFDVELLIHLAQERGADALAVEPIVFTEDFAASNFPSIAPGQRHLEMVRQIVNIYKQFVAPVTPATGEAADLLDLLSTLDLDGYVDLINHLHSKDEGDSTLFDRRWSVQHLRDAIRAA